LTQIQEPQSGPDPVSDVDAEAAAIARRGLYVRLMVILTAGIFLATASLIYYRWATTVEPTCVLVFNGKPQHAGIIIEVTDSGHTYSATIGPENRHSARFFLNEGLYHIRVYRGDVVYFDDHRGLRENYITTISLSSIVDGDDE
jgi:hypothetical protein